jgi:hypothetical protein
MYPISGSVIASHTRATSMIIPIQYALIPTVIAKKTGYKKFIMLNEPPPKTSADANANFCFNVFFDMGTP